MSRHNSPKKADEVMNPANDGAFSSPYSSTTTLNAPSSHSSTVTLNETITLNLVSTATWEREEQEADELFHQKVEKLCAELWPTPKSLKRRLAKVLRATKFFRPLLPMPQSLSVVHHRGIDPRHVTSISIPWYPNSEERNLFLRVPRWDADRFDRQVAILEYVKQKTAIPIPSTSATDLTDNNALGKPYMLQRRIPGSDLSSIWADLDHTQRCVIARELGGIVQSLLSAESDYGGLVEASSIDSTVDAFQIVPFEVKEGSNDEDADGIVSNLNQDSSVSSVPQNTFSLLQSLLRRWRASFVTVRGEIDNEVILWDRLLEALAEMESRQLFDNMPHCLSHEGLVPSHIMAQIQEGGSITITGVLDWDEAIIAPKFMACLPLAWLWDDTVFEEPRYDEETELDPWPYELAGDEVTPTSPEKQELKRIFDESAGPEYRRLAYGETNRLCRVLFRIAMKGMSDNEAWKAAERILQEWADLCAE